jgi:hypothetical protein
VKTKQKNLLLIQVYIAIIGLDVQIKKKEMVQKEFMKLAREK